MPSKQSRVVIGKGSDESSADEQDDDSEPDTVLYNDDSSTADTEDDISDAELPALGTLLSAQHTLRATAEFAPRVLQPFHTPSRRDDV